MRTLKDVLKGEVTQTLRKRGLTDEEIEKKKLENTIRPGNQGQAVHIQS